MKLTLKVFLAVCLFSSVTLAGDMTTGGFAGDMTTGGKTCTQNCITDDGQNDDTTTANDANSSSQTQDDESILTVIQEYLFSLFG
jgi:hypothetical protein